MIEENKALDRPTVLAIAERMDVLALTTEREASWESIYKALRHELARAL